MFKKQIKANYVSEIDTLLKNFEATHPQKTKFQQQEINKHKPIFEKRNNPNYSEDDKQIWENF